MCLIFIQYVAIYFLSTLIGGNIFINCILMGIGEIIAGLLSGFLLNKFKDTQVFLFASFIVGIFHTAFYFVPSGPYQYMCLLLTIFGVAT